MRPRDDTPWLHIRSQFTYHAEAFIAGTREGLTALRDAVDQAIADGEGEGQAFASDGEGYGIFVRRSSTVRGIGQPTYLDQEARELAAHEYEFLTRSEKHNRGVLARIEAATKAASVDTHPKGEDAKQASALLSSAVAKPDAPNQSEVSHD